MSTKIWIGVLLGLNLLFMPQVSLANSFKEYSEEAFDEAQKTGKTILLDFYASWCPTCRKQRKILDPLLNEDRFKGVVALSIDYDNSKELLKRFSVPRQSTLIVFKGDKEIDRSIGETHEEEIATLIVKGL